MLYLRQALQTNEGVERFPVADFRREPGPDELFTQYSYLFYACSAGIVISR